MPLLISTVVMFQAQNRKTIIVLEKLLCPSRSLWRRAWQRRVSQHNTRPARPRPRPQYARPRPRPIFLSQTGLVLRPTVSDHITDIRHDNHRGEGRVCKWSDMPAVSRGGVPARPNFGGALWRRTTAFGMVRLFCIDLCDTVETNKQNKTKIDQRIN